MNIKDLKPEAYTVVGQPKLNINNLPKNSYSLVDDNPVKPVEKPFTFDVPPVKKTSKEILAESRALTAQFDKEYKSASSPLGLAINTAKGIGETIASSEVALGKSATRIFGDKGKTYAKNIEGLSTSQNQLLVQIKEREKKGIDATPLKQQYNQNVAMIEENKKGLNEATNLPTQNQLLGQIGGTALDVLTAGTYGKATAGMKAGQLAPKTPLVKAATTAVSPELGQIVTQKAGGLFSKQGAINVAKGAGIGYAYDVTQGLQGNRGEDRQDMNAFKPGMGTLTGGVLAGALELNQTLKNRKLPETVIKNRENELAKINKQYATLRKFDNANSDGGKAIRNRVASTDVLVGTIDNDGKISTMIPNGAYDQYKKLTIDGTEDVVMKNLLREGNEVALDDVERYLKTTVNKSNMAGTEKLAAINGVKREIAGLKLDINPETGNLPVAVLQKSKIGKGIRTNYLDPVADKVTKTITRGLKEIIEKNTASIDVPAVNKELAKYYKDLSYIEKLDGKVVKGGKLGKYFATVTGNIVGGTLGGAIGGYPGAAVGGAVGGNIASKIKGAEMASKFGPEIGMIPEKSAILKNASELSKTTLAQKLTSPRKGTLADKILNTESRINQKNLSNVAPKIEPIQSIKIPEVPYNKVNDTSSINQPITKANKLSTSGGQGAPFTNSMSETSRTGNSASGSVKATMKDAEAIDRQVAIDFIDSVRTKKVGGAKITPKQKLDFEIEARQLAPKYKINPELSPAKLADAFDKQLSKIKAQLSENALIKEAKKYKTAEEFRKSVTQSHLMDLSNPDKHNIGRAFAHYKDEPLTDISDILRDGNKPGSYLSTIKYEYPEIYKKIISSKKTITIYRAVPENVGNDIRLGDYVALEKSYAQGHLKSVLEGEQGVKGKIISKEVPKSDVIWGEADFAEWAYSPRKLRDKYPTLDDIWKEANN